MDIRIQPPKEALYIVNTLQSCGYSASFVGGCVRDSLLEKVPKDWDICTSALPEEIRQVFSGRKLLDVGIKHGTVCIVFDHVPYEVTTYRVDGDYTDHRHPDDVHFVGDIRQDLARRDFTVNAMAWNPKDGLIDLFGGREDLKKKAIRCVGNPRDRFDEDALRILRALRFASTYDFVLDDATSDAVHTLYPTLDGIAAERIWQEMQKLLLGSGAGRILMDYADVFAHIMPPLKPCIGFDQRTPFHKYDVYEHMIRSVEACPKDSAIRLAMLLHDCGKPQAFTMDSKGIGHAHGHQEKSAVFAEGVLDRLKVDGKTRETVLDLVRYHDISIRLDRKSLLNRLNRFGEERFRQLILVHMADDMAKADWIRENAEKEYKARCDALDALLKEKPCYKLSDLAIRGGDLIRLGMKPGPEMGQVLSGLLNRVMDGTLENSREALLQAAQEDMHS